MKLDIKKTLARFNDLRNLRNNWINSWDLISRFVVGDSYSFESQNVEDRGEINTSEMSESTALLSKERLASILMALLWPGGRNTIKLNILVEELLNDKDSKEYFEKIIAKVIREMEDPNAGLALALKEHFNSSTSYGTSGVLVFRGSNSFFKFKSVDVKTCFIDENEEGLIDTLYIKKKKSVRKLVEEFGVNSLSEKTRGLYSSGKLTEMVEVLHVIEPRKSIDPSKENNLNMPFVSAHFEVSEEHLLRESGLEEFPGGISRFDKEIGEIYGRSPAMRAMPDILELNIVREMRTVAREKMLNPPLIVYDDGRLGNGVLNTSPNAINVLNIAGRTVGQLSPVQEMFSVRDISSISNEMEELKEVVTQHFLIDRLLDLNNNTPMTLGEAQLRDRKNSSSIRAITSRQETELFTPMIERCINLMFREGKLGVTEEMAAEQGLQEGVDDFILIPSVLAKYIGDNTSQLYQLEYNTPANRVIDSEQASGIVQTMQTAQQAAQTNPEALDVLDFKESIKVLGKLSGTPLSIFRTDKEIKDIEGARVQQQQQEQLQQQAILAAEVEKNQPQ